jgi:hypothetical protein
VIKATPEMQEIFPSTTFGYITIISIYVMTVYLPSQTAKGDDIEKPDVSIESFFNVMTNSVLLEELTDQTIKEFNGENMLFWIQYYNLMTSFFKDILTTIEMQGSTKSSEFLKCLCHSLQLEIPDLKYHLDMKYSPIIASMLIKNRDFHKGIPNSVFLNINSDESFILHDANLEKLIKINKDFLQSDSLNEINIEHRISLEVKTIIETLTKDRKNVRICVTSSYDVMEEIRRQHNGYSH